MQGLPKRAACIGGGVIGAGWVARLVLAGVDVTVHDPAPDAERVVREVLVWGVNFVVIKWGVSDLPPLLLGALRFMLAALPAGWLIARPALPWRYVLAYGLTMGVGQFGLLFSAMA